MGASTSRVPLPPHSVDWYRTPLDAATSARLHAPSDARGAAQTLGFLGVLLGAGALAVRASLAGDAWGAAAWSLAYGCVANFLINAMHELGHGSVFRTRALNAAFLRVVSFLGWLHPDMFFSSHLRHHRYTQNPPHDQENPVEAANRPLAAHAWTIAAAGLVNVRGARDALVQTARAALGLYPVGHLGWLPGWEAVCYPPDAPAARAPAQRWAAFLLAGHAAAAAVAAASGVRGAWLAPALLSFGPFLNGWLFLLCNSTQHVGLEAGAADFRKNTRSFHLAPPIAFLYWHMNYHVEHHMYANVPCYNLAALHKAIAHDLPPTPDGIAGVWRDIARDLKAMGEQKKGA